MDFIIHLLSAYVICTKYSTQFFLYFVTLNYVKGPTLDLDIPPKYVPHLIHFMDTLMGIQTSLVIGLLG